MSDKSTPYRKHDAGRVAFACGITVLIVVLVFYSLRWLIGSQ